MFRTNGSKNYKVLFVKGGKGQKGDYTFITVEDELRQNQKFTDKMKIHVWGENLEGTVIKGNYVKIREITDRNDKAFELYSNMLKKYSNKEPKTIMLYTRPMLDKNIVYVVDNRVVDEKEFMSLGMTKIESIKVIKDPENELFKRFAKEDTYQVLYVTLKE